MNIKRSFIVFLFYGPWISTMINYKFGFIITSTYVYLHYKYKHKILFWFEKYNKL